MATPIYLQSLDRAKFHRAPIWVPTPDRTKSLSCILIPFTRSDALDDSFSILSYFNISYDCCFALILCFYFFCDVGLKLFNLAASFWLLFINICPTNTRLSTIGWWVCWLCVYLMLCKSDEWQQANPLTVRLLIQLSNLLSVELEVAAV